MSMLQADFSLFEVRLSRSGMTGFVDGTEQDFLLTTNEVLPVRDPASYISYFLAGPMDPEAFHLNRLSGTALQYIFPRAWPFSWDFGYVDTRVRLIFS